MIAKEWLEDIKERFVKYQTDYNLNGEDVEWLINRIEELEKELNKQMNIGLKFEGEANELQKQNKRYREALEFYAESENYCVTFEDDYEPILKDNGKIARRALKGETK